VDRSYLLGIAISVGGFAAFFVTLQVMLQVGILRPRVWARRYTAGQLPSWRMRLPGYGPPLGAALLLGAGGVAVDDGVVRLALLLMAIVAILFALAIGLADPPWARPAWLREAGAGDIEEPRGERVLLVVGVIEIGVMVALYVIAEGITGYTVGLLLLALAAASRAIPRITRKVDRAPPPET
jgi:hypothetical protein